MLTKSAALELADWQVRVNAVCPGYVATPIGVGGSITDLGRDTAEERLAGNRQRMAQSQPLGRMGEADDIAELVTFLASDASSWITGTAQVIDGGLTLGKPWRKQPRGDHRAPADGLTAGAPPGQPGSSWRAVSEWSRSASRPSGRGVKPSGATSTGIRDRRWIARSVAPHACLKT